MKALAALAVLALFLLAGAGWYAALAVGEASRILAAQYYAAHPAALRP